MENHKNKWLVHWVTGGEILKVSDLIKKLEKVPKDYDITYLAAIGHLFLQEHHVSVFDKTKEVLLQTEDIVFK